MTIRPIKTEKDHAQALKRIEALMTARADTPEGDELDVPVTLVEAYEAKHYAIDAPDPIAAIHHRMEAMGRKVIHTGVEDIHKAVQGRDRGPGFRPPHRRRERSELP